MGRKNKMNKLPVYSIFNKNNIIAKKTCAIEIIGGRANNIFNIYFENL